MYNFSIFSPMFSTSATSSMTVKSNPEAAHPKGIEPGSHPSHQYRYQEHVESGQVDYGPATAPYPPPMPAGPSAGNSNDDLLANQEALERLAGRGNKRRKGGDIGKEHVLNKYEQFVLNTSYFCTMCDFQKCKKHYLHFQKW